MILHNKHFNIFSEVEVNNEPQDGTDTTAPAPVAAPPTTAQPMTQPAPAPTAQSAATPPAAPTATPADPAVAPHVDGGSPTPDYTTPDMPPPDAGAPAAGGDPAADPMAGDMPPEEGAEGEAPPADDGAVQADDARGLENEIFSTLTQDQVDQKHSELKNRFAELYEATDKLIDRINHIPGDERFIKTVEFISNTMNDLRDMVADYLKNSYSTKSYMENAINFNRFLATLHGVTQIIDRMYEKMKKEDKDA